MFSLLVTACKCYCDRKEHRICISNLLYSRQLKRWLVNEGHHNINRHTCLLAGIPTSFSPSEPKATTEGVVRAPSAFSITCRRNGWKDLKQRRFSNISIQVSQHNKFASAYLTLAALPSITATQELVVPRSTPMTAPFTPSDLYRTSILCASAVAVWAEKIPRLTKLVLKYLWFTWIAGQTRELSGGRDDGSAGVPRNRQHLKAGLWSENIKHVIVMVGRTFSTN